jgi:predicted nuclease with TOPRIM domain
MANEIQNLTTDISRLYEEITEKTQSLGHLEAITKLYEELQNELQEISADEIDLLQTQIKSSLEQMVGISKNLAVIRALKLTLNGHEDASESIKRFTASPGMRRTLEDR